jgi:hypothetical protein
MKTRWAMALLALWLIVTMGEALAQGQGIYTCVDKTGRKLTADRPIPECMDREQKILNPSGTVKSVLSPPKSEKELADIAAQKKKDAELQTQLEEEKKRDRALIGRYPNKAVHDKTRAEALKEISAVREIAVSRVKELMAQRDKIAAELEFYKKEPETAPASLRRRAEENARNTSEQRQFMAHQDQEVGRTNARFDEELTRLRPQWAMRESASK